MPFGPALAPAEMQGYVASMFGSLSNRTGEEWVLACTDDILIRIRWLKGPIEAYQAVNKEVDDDGLGVEVEKRSL